MPTGESTQNILVLGYPGWLNWRNSNEYEETQSEFYLKLNPAYVCHAPLGTVELTNRNNKPVGFYFIGSYRVTREPLQTIKSLLWAISKSKQSGLILDITIDEVSPALVQLLKTIIEIFKPEICYAYNSSENYLPFLVNDITLKKINLITNKRTPSQLKQQRKAKWVETIAKSKMVNLPFKSIEIQGICFGTGNNANAKQIDTLNEYGVKNILHAEIIGNLLYLVCNNKPKNESLEYASKKIKTSKYLIVQPKDFKNLIFGCEDKFSNHVAVGRITDMDFANGILLASVFGDHDTTLKKINIGRIKIDDKGVESAEIKAWQV
jgi:polynucleotide 5'-kinase involved in rRNA processing